MAAAKTDIKFEVRGVTLRGDLYAPESTALEGPRGAPVVVMAHGLSMTRDGGLAPFAECFAKLGCHVLVFDYRGFGDSDGTPRELVSIGRQLADYRGAIALARSLPGADPDRVALWGTSYSGGHVIELASRDSRIAAVISQVPNLDSLAALRFVLKNTPLRRLLWLARSIVLDALHGLTGRGAHYVRAIAPAGERASYVSDEGFEYVEAFKGPNFKNRFAPRGFLRVPPYRPGLRADRIACRVMFVAAERDDLTPPSAVYAAAQKLGERAELVRYPISHFAAYVEPTLSNALARQGEFLARELAP